MLNEMHFADAPESRRGMHDYFPGFYLVNYPAALDGHLLAQLKEPKPRRDIFSPRCYGYRSIIMNRDIFTLSLKGVKYGCISEPHLR